MSRHHHHHHHHRRHCGAAVEAETSHRECCPRTILPSEINRPGGFTISKPGLYRLCRDTNVDRLGTSQAAITIAASDVVLDGRDLVLAAATPAGATTETVGIRLAEGIQNVTIRQLTIRGFGLLGIYGPRVRNTILLEDLLVEENGVGTSAGIPVPIFDILTGAGPGFLAGGVAIVGESPPDAASTDLQPPTDVTLRRCRLLRNHGASQGTLGVPTNGAGLLLMHATGIHVFGSNFNSNGSIVLETLNPNPTALSPTNGLGAVLFHVRAVDIHRSTFDDQLGDDFGGGLFFPLQGAVFPPPTSTMRSENIKIYDSSMSLGRSVHSHCTGLTLAHCDDVLLERCALVKNLANGLAAVDSTGIVAHDCQFNGQYSGPDTGLNGIAMETCQHCAFYDCQIANNANAAPTPLLPGGDGVFLLECNDLLFERCALQHNGSTALTPGALSGGVVVEGATQLTLRNCVVSESIGPGIVVVAGTGLFVQDCELTHNTGPGVLDFNGLAVPEPPFPVTSPLNTVNVYVDNFAVGNVPQNFAGLPEGTPILTWVLGTPNPALQTAGKITNLDIIETDPTPSENAASGISALRARFRRVSTHSDAKLRLR